MPTGRPSTSATAPTCTPPRTSPASSSSSTRTPCRSASALGADVLGLGPVAGRAGRRRAGRRPGAAPAAARRADRARPGGGHPQRLPVPGLPGAGGQARRLPPRLDHRASGWRTPSTWPGCWPTCCPTTPPGARSPPCRWPGGTRGTPPGPAAAGAPLDELAAGLADVARDTGRDGAGRLRARARLRGGDHRPGRPRCCPAWTPTGSASASTWPTWPAPGRSPPTALAGCATAGLPVVKVQVSAALRGRRPGRRGRRAAARASSRASCTRPGRAGGAGCRPDDLRRGASTARTRLPGPWRVHYHVPLHAPPVPPLARPRRCCARAARAARRRPGRVLRPPRRRDVHLGGAAAGRSGPTTDAELAAGIAAELAFARDELHRAGLGASVTGSDPMSPLVVLDVVGLTPRLLDAHAAAARASPTAASGPRSAPVLPAVTCSVQSTFLTGELPSRARHRRQRLVLPRPGRGACCGGSTTRWSAGRSSGRRPAAPCPATRWPTSAGGTRWAPTSTGPSRPRPIYHADGRKEPDCYTDPPELHDELTGALGTFPLFTYWGPGAGLPSSRVDLPGRRADHGRPRDPT